MGWQGGGEIGQWLITHQKGRFFVFYPPVWVHTAWSRPTCTEWRAWGPVFQKIWLRRAAGTVVALISSLWQGELCLILWTQLFPHVPISITPGAITICLSTPILICKSLSWVSLCGESQGQSKLRGPRPVSGVILRPSVWGSVGPWLAPPLFSPLQTSLVSMILLLAHCWDSSLHLASVLNATDLLGSSHKKRKDSLQPHPSNSWILTTKWGHTYTD